VPLIYDVVLANFERNSYANTLWMTKDFLAGAEDHSPPPGY
jgi:hypothetical protein